MRDTKAPVETSKEVEESKQSTDAWSKESADVRQVAVRVVDDVLTRAAEQADGQGKDNEGHQGAAAAADMDSLKEQAEDDDFSGAPTIQIDLVGSRTPSPEEEESVIQFPTYESKRKSRKEEEARKAEEDSRKDQSPVEDTASLREYLVGYVQELLKKAVPLAEEKLATKVDTMDVAVATGSGSKGRRAPWHARFRAAFSSFLQAVCVCGDRRDDPCS